jgi:hypothetical protein
MPNESKVMTVTVTIAIEVAGERMTSIIENTSKQIGFVGTMPAILEKRVDAAVEDVRNATVNHLGNLR